MRIPQPRDRWIGKALVVVFGGMLLGLLLAEVGLRLFGIGEQGLYQWDADRGWGLRPGASEWQSREGNAFVQINREGMRDREHSYRKPADSIRIAFIGDSFTEAEQVALKDDYVSVVEDGIRTCPRLRAKSVETLNFGCDSYGTAQEFITLQRSVWKYSPDIVVLLFFAGNDLRNNSLDLEWHMCQPFYLLEGDELVLNGPFIKSPIFRAECAVKFESRRSAVLNVVGDSIIRIRAAARGKKALFAEVESNAVAASRPTAPSQAVTATEPGLADAIYKPPQNQVWEDAWRVTEKLILAINADVRAHGARFLLVTATVGSQVAPDAARRAQYAKSLGVKDLFYADSRLKEFGTRAGIDVLNLAPAFQNYADEHHAYLHGFANTKLGTGHWNEAGHRLAGELIAGHLCNLLDSSGL